MPLAVVLELSALSSGSYRYDTGKGVHGWWFHAWQDRPQVSQAMHDPNGPAPFTLSALRGLPPAAGDGLVRLAAGQPAWLRFTVLDEALEALVLQPGSGWLAALPLRLEVAGLAWGVRAVHTTLQGHAWAGYASYAELLGGLDRPDAPDYWTWEIASPLAFNGRKFQFPFPGPELVVRSLVQRWNAFAPQLLPEALVEQARDNLAIAHYDLRTQAVQEGRTRTTGCVGRMAWRAVDMSAGLRRAVDLLGRYAFYAGVGYHTTRGLGQMRLAERRW